VTTNVSVAKKTNKSYEIAVAAQVPILWRGGGEAAGVVYKNITSGRE
jgi:hypothetical protein